MRAFKVFGSLRLVAARDMDVLLVRSSHIVIPETGPGKPVSPTFQRERRMRLPAGEPGVKHVYLIDLY
jgi:hypothetical protein